MQAQASHTAAWSESEAIWFGNVLCYQPTVPWFGKARLWWTSYCSCLHSGLIPQSSEIEYFNADPDVLEQFGLGDHGLPCMRNAGRFPRRSTYLHQSSMW